MGGDQLREFGAEDVWIHDVGRKGRAGAVRPGPRGVGVAAIAHAVQAMQEAVWCVQELDPLVTGSAEHAVLGVDARDARRLLAGFSTHHATPLAWRVSTNSAMVL